MAAEGLPTGGPPNSMPSWELEAWYQDLEEVLAAASAPPQPWGAEQTPLWGSEGAGSLGGGCGPGAALAAELLEPEGTGSAEPAGPPGIPPGPGTTEEEEEEEDEEGVGRGLKRKRCQVGSREVAKRRERANEQRVLELRAQNERLRTEIGRLSAEVQSTRAALIDRIVNLRRAEVLHQAL